MTKSLTAALAATILAGCAHAPAPKSLGCRPEPQWYVNDDKGIPSAAVLVCFRDDGVLTFGSRRLTLEELAARTTPPSKAVPAAVKEALQSPTAPKPPKKSKHAGDVEAGLKKLKDEVDAEIAKREKALRVQAEVARMQAMADRAREASRP